MCLRLFVFVCISINSIVFYLINYELTTILPNECRIALLWLDLYNYLIASYNINDYQLAQSIPQANQLFQCLASFIYVLARFRFL